MPRLSKFFRSLVQETEEIMKSQEEEVPTILKTEAKEQRFEEAHEFRNKLFMNDEDKLQSMRNAIAILPPNMVINGRHTKENIGAICGFKVTDDQWDAIYEPI
jgi:hypothetical protein